MTTATTATTSSTDPSLAPFLTPTFSAVDYLNAVLPSWSPSSTTSTSTSTSTTATATSSTPTPSRPIPLPTQPQTQTQTHNLATATRDTQDLLTKLTATLSRLTAALTAQTDDILRSGSRLAYEVEVLRGDVGGLSEALASDAEGGLRGEFVRLGIWGACASGGGSGSGSTAATAEGTNTANGTNGTNGALETGEDAAHPAQQMSLNDQKPEYIRSLHVLTQVRANLDRVVSVFGAAMEWVVPPSDVSSSSSHSMSASTSTATPASRGEQEDAEAKGREYAARVRDEILLLLRDDGEGDGVAGAEKRVHELRELMIVWKGTGEEGARRRFVDGLGKLVQEERVRLGGQRMG